MGIIDLVRVLCKALRVRLLTMFIDLWITFFLGIWLTGGIPWQGRFLLHHGADPRRAALVLLGLGALLAWRWFPQMWERSFWLRVARGGIRVLHRPRVRWALLGGVAGWAILIGVLQALALRYPLYDVGIFQQIFWSLAHGHGFLSTISGAGNFLADHASVSFLALVPFYWLADSSPLLLPVLQALLVFGGVAAWIFLAERMPGASSATRARLAAATTLFGISFDSLWGNLRWGFHENSIAFCALSWAFALLCADFPGTDLPGTDLRNRKPLRIVGIVLCLLLAAGSKETLLLSVAGVFVAWSLAIALGNPKATTIPRRLPRVVGMAACLSVSVLLVWLFVGFERMPHPADKNYFQRYYAYLGTDIGGFARTLLTSPGKIVQAVGAAELVRYAKTVLWPWLALPLFWPLAWVWSQVRRQVRSQVRRQRVRGQTPKPLHAGAETLAALSGSSWGRPATLTVLGASTGFSWASAALSTYPALRGSGFHYVLELWPAFAVLTLFALARIEAVASSTLQQAQRPTSRWRAGLRAAVSAGALTWLWPLLALLALDQDPVGQLREYAIGAREAAPARSAMLALPPDQSVAASELAGPWVANRKQVTRWPDLSAFDQQCPDWIVLPASDESDAATVLAEVARARPCGGEAADAQAKAAASARPELAWKQGGWAGVRRVR